MDARPLENCTVCGDRVPGGDHECWARTKWRTVEKLQCRYCGYLMIAGVCTRMSCFEQ